MIPSNPSSSSPRRYYRKRVDLFRLVDKIKLWPSRQGVLHGVKLCQLNGGLIHITTHCGAVFTVNNSRNSRSARWLRNKWQKSLCPLCKIPEWKIEKYQSTRFRRHYGSFLSSNPPS